MIPIKSDDCVYPKPSLHAWCKEKMCSDNLLDTGICQESYVRWHFWSLNSSLPLCPRFPLTPHPSTKQAPLSAPSGLGALVHEFPPPGTPHPELDSPHLRSQLHCHFFCKQKPLCFPMRHCQDALCFSVVLLPAGRGLPTEPQASEDGDCVLFAIPYQRLAQSSVQ